MFAFITMILKLISNIRRNVKFDLVHNCANYYLFIIFHIKYLTVMCVCVCVFYGKIIPFLFSMSKLRLDYYFF